MCVLARAEWARTQAWKRGGLLADEVARYAGRSAGAAGKRKLRDEEEDEDDDGEQARTPLQRAGHARS